MPAEFAGVIFFVAFAAGVLLERRRTSGRLARLESENAMLSEAIRMTVLHDRVLEKWEKANVEAMRLAEATPRSNAGASRIPDPQGHSRLGPVRPWHRDAERDPGNP